MPRVTTLAQLPGPAELAGNGAILRRVVIKAGHVADRHHHEYEQFLYVASGGGMLSCEGGEVELAPGTMLHLEPGAWHSATFGPETVLIEVNLNPV